MDRAKILRERIDVFRKVLQLRPYASESDFYRRQIAKDKAELAEIERPGRGFTTVNRRRYLSCE